MTKNERQYDASVVIGGDEYGVYSVVGGWTAPSNGMTYAYRDDALRQEVYACLVADGEAPDRADDVDLSLYHVETR